MIGYGIIPLLILLRTFYTAICLITGVFLFEQNLRFSQCFNIAIKADVIFLLELIVKINYFSIVEVNSLQEINTRLFSVLQWVGTNNVEQWLLYPISILNIFELIYCILLALLLSNYTKKSFIKSLTFVSKTYLIGLFLWAIFIMYIILFLF
jgi:hypothetical protein